MANINKCGSNNKANGKYHLKVLNNPKPNSRKFINHIQVIKYNTNLK